LAKGDFNNDGKLDLATFQAGDPGPPTTGAMSVLLGEGDGAFQPPNVTKLDVATDIVVADFNLDHKADVAIADLDSSGKINILTGNGDGTFQSAKQEATLQSTVSPGGIQISRGRRFQQ